MIKVGKDWVCLRTTIAIESHLLPCVVRWFVDIIIVKDLGPKVPKNASVDMTCRWVAFSVGIAFPSSPGKRLYPENEILPGSDCNLQYCSNCYRVCSKGHLLLIFQLYITENT